MQDYVKKGFEHLLPDIRAGGRTENMGGEGNKVYKDFWWNSFDYNYLAQNLEGKLSPFPPIPTGLACWRARFDRFPTPPLKCTYFFHDSIWILHM